MTLGTGISDHLTASREAHSSVINNDLDNGFNVSSSNFNDFNDTFTIALNVETIN